MATVTSVCGNGMHPLIIVLLEYHITLSITTAALQGIKSSYATTPA